MFFPFLGRKIIHIPQHALFQGHARRSPYDNKSSLTAVAMSEDHLPVFTGKKKELQIFLQDIKVLPLYNPLLLSVYLYIQIYTHTHKSYREIGICCVMRCYICQQTLLPSVSSSRGRSIFALFGGCNTKRAHTIQRCH